MHPKKIKTGKERSGKKPVRSWKFYACSRLLECFTPCIYRLFAWLKIPKD